MMWIFMAGGVLPSTGLNQPHKSGGVRGSTRETVTDGTCLTQRTWLLN